MEAEISPFISVGNWILGWGHDDWLAFGTFIIAVFTAILGGGTIFLVRDGRKHSERQLRAFVYNNRVTWKSFQRTGSRWTKDVGWVFTTNWHNNGPTQAPKFSNHTSWDVFVDNSSDDLPRDFKFHDMGALGAVTYMAPNGTLPSEDLWIDANHLDAVRMGHLRLFYWGWARYRDIFNKPHMTQFCFEISVQGDPYQVPTGPSEKATIVFVFRLCRKYNCVDEDCE